MVPNCCDLSLVDIDNIEDDGDAPTAPGVGWKLGAEYKLEYDDAFGAFIEGSWAMAPGASVSTSEEMDGGYTPVFERP